MAVKCNNKKRGKGKYIRYFFLTFPKYPVARKKTAATQLERSNQEFVSIFEVYSENDAFNDNLTLINNMLTEAQEKFLQTIPNDKIAVIKPWDPKTRKVTQKLITRIKAADMELKILYTGASALGIAGINDIDIAILCSAKDFIRHLPKLEPILGKPSKITQENVWWEDGLVIEGYLVEVYMTDPNSPTAQEHFKIFEILKDDDKLRAEYQKLKENANGLPYREYQKRKYEFYNKVLKLKHKNQS